MSGERSSTHLCPRCGIRTPTKGRGRGLCPDCQWSPKNSSYTWTAAQTEVRRLFRSPCACGAGTWESCEGCQRAIARRLRVSA